LLLALCRYKDDGFVKMSQKIIIIKRICKEEIDIKDFDYKLPFIYKYLIEQI